MLSSSRSVLALAVCSLLLASCGTTRAISFPFLIKDVERLRANEERSGVLGAQEAINPATGAPYRTYEIRLRTGDVLLATVSSSGFSPALSLFTQDGTLVGTTGHPPGRRVSLTRRAPEAGSYILVVSGLSSGDFGPFELRTELIETDDELSLPGEVQGHLIGGGALHPTTSGHMNAYRFDLSETSTVGITLRSTDFDAFLSLVDLESGNIIAENDDFGGTTDSRLVMDLGPGTYEILATSYDRDSIGRYTLSLEKLEVERSREFQLESPFFGLLGANRRPVPASRREGYPISVHIEQPGLYDFTMRSEDFDSYLVLTTDCGTVLEMDDDSGGGLDARITHYFPEPGSYVLWATSQSADGGGRYTVLGRGLSLPEPISTISMGTSIEGELTDESDVCHRRGSPIEYYSLIIEKPKEVQIDLMSDQIDTYLVLETESGSLIDENDDIPSSTNSRLVKDLVPGTYRIGATSFDEADRGGFTLMVRAVRDLD